MRASIYLTVLVAYFREGTALGNTVAKLDFWFRWALIAAVIASTAWSFGAEVDSTSAGSGTLPSRVEGAHLSRLAACV